MDPEKNKQSPPLTEDADPTAAQRKRDHIELAFRSQVEAAHIDGRFNYEPLLSAHPEGRTLAPFEFLGKTLQAPLWVSSMTGGTAMARTINHNLARACRDFGMGMGLGSCRALLYSDEYLPDFAVRPLIGPSLPLYANLGIAQLEQLFKRKETYLIPALLEKLQADGLIIHVNPMQEWLQPEGDRFHRPPLETIEAVLAIADYPVIVKEVGQGMGPRSLEALLQLPLAAIDCAASGGTNFALLELLRADEAAREAYEPLARVGHSAEEMVRLINSLCHSLGDRRRCQQVIVSGGIRNFLDGYYLIQQLSLPSVYGQASGFLKHARDDYDTLYRYVERQVQGLALAYAYLRVKTPQD